MKRLITLFFLFSLILASLSAQIVATVQPAKTSDGTPFIKNEGYITLGTVSCVGLLGGMFFSIADAIADAVNDTDVENEGTFQAYSVGIGYNLFLVDFIGIGGFVHVENFGGLSLKTIQAKLTAQYGWRHFKFYHAVSGGVMFINENAICPAFDVTLLGLKLDLDNFNIFVEGALPATGMLKAGASIYF